MRLLPRLEGEISPAAYAIAAPAVLLSQHAAVAAAYAIAGRPLVSDIIFWLLPFRTFARLPHQWSWTMLFFTFGLAVAWTLAVLSLRRASRSGWGFGLATLSIVPAVQIAVVAALAVLPVRPRDETSEPDEPVDAAVDAAAMVRGLLAGVALVVLAVVVSALLFGTYGWGLFVLTPFFVGVTTAYLSNRRSPIDIGDTFLLVMGAAGLGCLALVALALEGIVCLLMAAPLGALAATAGGALGRAIAIAGHHLGSRPLTSIAVLPAVFAFEAALPPIVELQSHAAIDIAAPPSAVWRTLTSADDIGPEPDFIFRLGLAYPLRSTILGSGVGAERLGEFSTGTARERITAWEPGRRLAFAVESQPPAMEEFSPYETVHAPHVHGYFETETTSFDLLALPDGRTRLVARASHSLRLDPVLYWEPMARWAIDRNMARVLRHIRTGSEAAASIAERKG